MADPHPLFGDTSAAGGGGAQPGRGYGAPPAAAAASWDPPAAAFLGEPVSSLAMAYGSSLASQARDIMDRNVSGGGTRHGGAPWPVTGTPHGPLTLRRLLLDRFIPVGRLKYYFAVDTAYVGRKLGLLIFPFAHPVRGGPGIGGGGGVRCRGSSMGLEGGGLGGRFWGFGGRGGRYWGFGVCYGSLGGSYWSRGAGIAGREAVLGRGGPVWGFWGAVLGGLGVWYWARGGP